MLHDVYSLFYNGLMCFMINCTNGLAPHKVFYAYDDQSIIRNERGAGERYAELFQVYVDQCHLFR